MQISIILVTIVIITVLQYHTVMSKTIKKALIIGGGPSGLVASLMLQRKGWSTTILEQRSEYSPDDESKAYAYFLDGRGQRITDYLNITTDIAKYSVTNKQFVKLEMFLPDGVRKTVKLPPVAKTDITKYWISRSKFLSILQTVIYRKNGIASNSIFGDDVCKFPIEMVFGAKCTDVSFNVDPTSENMRVNVTLYDANKKNYRSLVREADLVLACDGINSVVRQSLSNMSMCRDPLLSHVRSDAFETTSFDSPAVGLYFKTMPISSPEQLQLKPEEGMSIIGAGKSKQSFLNLGLLPVKEGSKRMFNFHCRSDHELWKVKTVNELSQFLAKSFPQLHPFERFVPKNAFSKFLEQTPSVFPRPQYVNTLAALFKSRRPGIAHTSASNGVVLIGDAAHAFPPDVGQGVNSCLDDIYQLKDCMDSANDDLSVALPLYNRKHLGDVKALCQLNSFAFPYQYNQDKFMKNLYYLNFALRIGLNKIVPFLVSPPAFMLIGNHKLSYSEVLFRVTVSSAVIDLSLLGTILGFATRWLNMQASKLVCLSLAFAYVVLKGFLQFK